MSPVRSDCSESSYESGSTYQLPSLQIIKTRLGLVQSQEKPADARKVFAATSSDDDVNKSGNLTSKRNGEKKKTTSRETVTEVISKLEALAANMELKTKQELDELRNKNLNSKQVSQESPVSPNKNSNHRSCSKIPVYVRVHSVAVDQRRERTKTDKEIFNLRQSTPVSKLVRKYGSLSKIPVRVNPSHSVDSRASLLVRASSASRIPRLIRPISKPFSRKLCKLCGDRFHHLLRYTCRS